MFSVAHEQLDGPRVLQASHMQVLKYAHASSRTRTHVYSPVYTHVRVLSPLQK